MNAAPERFVLNGTYLSRFAPVRQGPLVTRVRPRFLVGLECGTDPGYTRCAHGIDNQMSEILTLLGNASLATQGLPILGAQGTGHFSRSECLVPDLGTYYSRPISH